MLPSLFISHGSPMLALEPGASGPALARLAAELPKPKAIVIVSAHWESHELLVSSHAQPETWHDFGGFPAALYRLQYAVDGAPDVAQRALDLIETTAVRDYWLGRWFPTPAGASTYGCPNAPLTKPCVAQVVSTFEKVCLPAVRAAHVNAPNELSAAVRTKAVEGNCRSWIDPQLGKAAEIATASAAGAARHRSTGE